MCETTASAWYLKTVFGHVPAMQCVPVAEDPAIHAHRGKQRPTKDFADIPLWEPSEVLSALSTLALPATTADDDDGVDIVGRDAIADLPSDMRRRAKAGDRLKVVFNTGEDEIKTFSPEQPLPSGGTMIPEKPKRGILRSVSKQDQHEDGAPEEERENGNHEEIVASLKPQEISDDEHLTKKERKTGH